jgi:uncharacterized cupin superfamily protein
MIPPEPPPGRSRFGNVLNAGELSWQPWSQEKGRYAGKERSVARHIGARDLGYHLEILDPGKLSVPYHFHHHEEEMFYVLEGRALLRQGDKDGEEEIEVGPGDFIAFPPGTGIAHQFRNPSDRPFVFLAVSTKVASEVVEYPDSDKILIGSKGLMLRRRPELDYWDGEA